MRVRQSGPKSPLERDPKREIAGDSG
jgi:hypothetical protein